jgi:hypothetical protein
LQATAGDVAFVGIAIDGITIDANTLSIEINRDDDDTLVNYAAQPLTVITGPTTDLTFNMDAADGQLLRASGNISLNLFNFFQVSGGFAIEKSSKTVKVYKDDNNLATTDDNTDVAVDLLTIGGNDVNAFAGMNGGSANPLGLNLTGVDFAFALLSEQTGDERQWVSLQATADNVSFVGIDGLTVSVDTLSIEVNRAAADGSLMNYAAQPLTVTTGPTTTLTFDMDAADGELLRASGNLTLNVFDFFQVSGSFAIEKKIETVTLSNGEEIEVDLLAIGAAGVTAFAGLNGATLNKLGLDLTNVNFGLALMTDREDATRKFASLTATAGSASFVGIDGLIVSADTLEVLINHGIEVATQLGSTTKTNTLYLLNIFADTIGTLTFKYNDSIEM